jgi:hypothetical protein
LKLTPDEKEMILTRIISEGFRESLPVLSVGWIQPQMPVRLSLRFVRKMKEEMESGGGQHWMRYYQIKGLGPAADQKRVQEWEQQGKAGPRPKRSEELGYQHLAEAMWPIIRSGRKPLELRLRRMIAKWVWGTVFLFFSSEEDLWYFALIHVFFDWHGFVIGRYGDDTKRLLQDVKTRAHQLQDPEIRAEICRGIEDQNSWEEIQLKIHHRVIRLRYDEQSLRDSMNWWLTAQGIYVDEYDFAMLDQQILFRQHGVDREDPDFPLRGWTEWLGTDDVLYGTDPWANFNDDDRVFKPDQFTGEVTPDLPGRRHEREEKEWNGLAEEFDRELERLEEELESESPGE